MTKANPIETNNPRMEAEYIVCMPLVAEVGDDVCEVEAEDDPTVAACEV